MFKRPWTEKGQIVFPVLGLFVVLLIALTLVVDFGRYMLLRSRVRTIADTAALAGAGALDIRRSAGGNFTLNPTWATERAQQVYAETIARNPQDAWMSIGLSGIQVEARAVTVTVSGSCDSIWGGVVGIDSFSTQVTSSARSAVGITQER